MKINNLFKSITITSLFFGAMVLSGTTSSKAVLQSNGNTGATYNLSDWMINVRKMEQLGGAMGLSETLNSNLTSSSDSNNIDVHMQKNTEYGALAILSASSYGNPNKINAGETTTGNVTGVVMNLNWEWVAAGMTSAGTNYNNAVGRYKNIYTQEYEPKLGDAMLETRLWGSTNEDNFLWAIAGGRGVIRAYDRKWSGNSSIFTYGTAGIKGDGSMGYYDADYWNAYRSRAVIVQGEGV